MMLLATDRLMFEPPASARTVVPLNRGTLVEMTVSESCLAVRADCVADDFVVFLVDEEWSRGSR